MDTDCEGVIYLHTHILAVSDREGEASEESTENL